VETNVAAHSHDSHDDHGISHVLSWQLLVGVWAVLIALTVVTVLATRIDFGSSWNLAIAMIIAKVKAGLVVVFFMHLLYDRLFHSVLFLSGLLAALLFVGFALMDSGQYQNEIIWGSDQSATP
jgi:cytochrome c oxidase subunit IV